MNTIEDIIKIAKVSQYLIQNDIIDKGLYGGGTDLLLPRKIYNIRKSLEWAYGYNIEEVKATGTITVDTVGDVGDTIEVFVNDPFLGTISLGVYELDDSDTTVNIIASHISNAIANNLYGYTTSVNNNIITITAAAGTGALINGGNNLYCNITTPNFLSTQINQIIQTENSLNFIV